MSARKLIIDADPGIGDAIAIALALCDPDLEVLALTTTGGRVSGTQAFRHIQTVLSIIDPPRWPRLGASQLSECTPPDHPGKSGLLPNGHDRLADCPKIGAELHQPHDSAKLLVDLVKQYQHEVTLLTLGPLTNLAVASELWPELRAHLQHVVCLAGSLGMGDATAVSEFNIFADPEAARKVIRAQAPLTIIPLETASSLILTFDDFDQLPIDEFSRLGRLLHQTMPYLLRETRNQLGREEIDLREVAALAAVAHPNLFETESLELDIELTGELTRGMTVIDRRGVVDTEFAIDVATHASLEGVRDYMLRLIQASSLK